MGPDNPVIGPQVRNGIPFPGRYPVLLKQFFQGGGMHPPRQREPLTAAAPVQFKVGTAQQVITIEATLLP